MLLTPIIKSVAELLLTMIISFPVQQKTRITECCICLPKNTCSCMFNSRIRSTKYIITKGKIENNSTGLYGYLLSTNTEEYVPSWRGSFVSTFLQKRKRKTEHLGISFFSHRKAQPCIVLNKIYYQLANCTRFLHMGYVSTIWYLM